MASTDPLPAHDRLLPRLARNIGWLLGGKGITGLFSLIYLALAARTLGPIRFGVFMLVLTYAQLFANIIQFQSWKGVIRFGALHLAEGRRGHLARVLGFSAVLDWSSALIGAALAAVGAFIVGPMFSWTPEVQREAAIFSAALLFSTGATPTGILRLFDRFDLLTYSEAFMPTVRLIGAIVAWRVSGGVGTFLFVWGLSSVVQYAATWVTAMIINRGGLALGRRSLAQAMDENPKLWRFMWQTSLSSSFGFLWLQAGTLAVGAYAGPAMAGGFRLADRVANALARPTETITRALYPELARLVASDDRATLRTLFRRTVVISGLLAVLIVVITATGGHLILRLIAGKHFEFAQPFLLLLSIAAAINIAGFVLEPFHNAHGRSGRVLRARMVAAAVYIVFLAALLPTLGAIGAAIAAVVTAAVIVGQLALSARDILRRGRIEPRTVEAPVPSVAAD